MSKKNKNLVIPESDLLGVTSSSSSESPEEQFPIVGIGASAGGLKAIEVLIQHIPPNSGIAFVIVQHLDPDSKGMMCELLQRITAMSVVTVTDRLKVQPNHVYVIPPNRSMSLLSGLFHLFEPIESRGLRLPIDFFFRSLAEEKQEQSIGIILSGMGSDGSLGVRAIKERSGIVLIQDPASAEFDSMPASAIETITPDVIAPPEEIISQLFRILNAPVMSRSIPDHDKDESALEKIVILLRAQCGNDFSKYKKNTLQRRIERRMIIHQFSKSNDYIRFLQENPSELQILFKELLIGVTAFFRDPAVWEMFGEQVLPELFRRMNPGDNVLRAWVPGCSTGEEAFSLAIVFKEALEKANLNKNISLQIFATDLDSQAIEKARKGLFPLNIESDVTQPRLNRFFIKSENVYRVNAEIREMIVFATQNIIKDPPFTKLDILSCRNLLIYFNAELQKNILTLFHYSLRVGGILILGNAETNVLREGVFAMVDSKLRIYQKSNQTTNGGSTDAPAQFPISSMPLAASPTTVKSVENIQSLAEQLVLNQYTPASVLVSDQGDILFITGSTGKYLEPATGKANMNLFAMAREGLRDELPSAFRLARKNYDKVVLNNVVVLNETGKTYLDVIIQQIGKPHQLQGRILVVFREILPIGIETAKGSRKKGNKANLELEQEIQRLKAELHGTREEMKISQEELKSTNEELQSTNEELQSTNEELTTSKEELQSINEELHTVNRELQVKIDDFGRINNDMKNLLNSIEIATLFLDKELRIRQFTIPATKIFKLIQSDVGRLFTDQVSVLEYPDIYYDANEVLRTLVFSEKVVPSRDGKWFMVRIMPYRTYEDKIDGLVVTCIDITLSKKQEKALAISSSLVETLRKGFHGLIIGLQCDGTVFECNAGAEKHLSVKRKQIIGKDYFGIAKTKAFHQLFSHKFEKTVPDETFSQVIEYLNAKLNTSAKVDWQFHPLFKDDLEISGILCCGELE